MNPSIPPPSPTAPGRRPLYLAWTGFQRRQVSMAELVDFECLFLPLAYKGRHHLLRAWHYGALAWRTLSALRRRRPPVIWLQLPQVPLLWVALLYRAAFDRRVELVADCHNAMFVPPWSRVPLGVSLLARCDAVLVHNHWVLAQALARGVPGARLCVLEDVPPLRQGGRELPVPAAFAGRARPWVLFAGSYGRDEPIAELLQAARLLAGGVVAVTGRSSNAQRNGHDLSVVPANVVLTDYLPVPEFDALMAHCDLVLALTRFDGIQLSACNEALGFGRPLVVSDTPLLRELFGSAAVMVDSGDAASITAGVRMAWGEREWLADASSVLARQRRRHWQHGPLRECLALLHDEARRFQEAAG